MQLAGIESLSQYFDLVQTSNEEAEDLANDFSITVTSFFRDPEVFDELSARIIPELFARHEGDGPVRVWSVGCATGEEAYSLAILMLEHVEREGLDTMIQIFASDMHQGSLKRARRKISRRYRGRRLI